MKSSIQTVTALLLILPTATHAAVIYEGFNYPEPGTADNSGLSGLNGGSGWSAAWGANNNGFLTNPSSTLSYGNLATSQGLVDDDNTGTNQAYARSSSLTGLDPDADGERWFSMILRVDSLTSTPTANARTMAAGLADATSGTEIGNSAGVTITGNSAGDGYTWGASLGTNTGTQTALASTGTFFFVGKYSLVGAGGSNDMMEIWLNPTALGTGTLTSGSSADGYSSFTANKEIGASDFLFNATGGNSGNSFTGALDEIRLGDTYAEVTPVVPEPSSMALVAIGGLMLMARRRS